MANTKIVEGEKPYTGGTAIEVDNINKIISLLLRSEDNLLHVNGDNELYCDLQIANGIAPTDDFEVGVTTGIVNANDGRDQNGLLLHYETISGAYAQWLYGADGKLYFDGGTGTFKQVYYSEEVDTLIQNLANSISAVGYSGEYVDLLNRPGIVKISYSLADDEWIKEGDIIDNCTVLITPYNSIVPASLTVDGVTYTVTGNNGNDLTVYGAEPLICLYQTDGTTKYFNSFLRAYDSALSSTSENAVQNKVVKAELDLKANISDIGNAVLTIQKNGTTIDTFTANATVDKTINVTVPTALSDLTNDVVNDGNLTIKRNHTTIAEFSANDATNVIADLSVPEVINNTTTVDSSNALSAAMGKELQDQIDNINTIGRFLSLWNCTTGLPQTDPTVSPYTYHTGDYYVVGAVSTGTNYKPDGGSYTIGVASTTVETSTVAVGDLYFYDGTTWSLKPFTGQTMPIDNVLSTTSTNAVENRVVTNALLGKADLVSSAVSGDLAGLDANGNITDSGIAATDVEQTTNKETGSSLTDSTTLYPSSHTVYEAIGALTTGVSSVNTQTGAVTLDADDISDTSTTNKWTNTTEKNTWNGKQDALTLATSPTQGNLVVWGADNKTFADGGSIPVTSVNGQTGAVTVETPNVKLFTLSSTSDTTTAQDAVDRILAGKFAVLKLGDLRYELYLTVAGTGTSYEFHTGALYSNSSSDTDSLDHIITINTDVNDTVTTILSQSFSTAYLDTQINYGTPYTPLYDGSPATKKYVDDHAGITNDTTGTTTTVTAIRAGTEAEYALITPNANTIYHIY